MAPSKLTVLFPLTILMLGASTAPVASPANVPGPRVPGPTPQKRGYDGDWLFSRDSDLDTAQKPTYKSVSGEKFVVVNEPVQEKRGYDGDWLYSRQSANALSEKPEVGTQK